MVADSLGASAAYWTSWSLDSLGDRSSQVQHAFTGGPAADTTTGYTYGTGGNQPHTLTATGTTGAATASTAYAYDAQGNMTSRKAGQGSQTIGYDDVGNLTSVTGSTGGNTSYEYAADGSMLLQKDPGTTTLYVGNQQYALNTSTGTVTGTRYYALPDGSQAIRTGSTATAFTYAIADPHGTPSLYLDSTTTTPTWRQYTPYGGARGTTITTPDNRGFLNKPMDTTTGLTIVGARQYDPGTGRFITDDPILEQTDPTQVNGYSYAGNNPIGYADPSGLNRLGDAGGCGGAYASVNRYSGVCTVSSKAPWHDPTHVSSVMDGVANALHETAKSLVKLDADEIKCGIGRGCGNLEQDGKAAAHQWLTGMRCVYGWDANACKQGLGSFGCAKFDGNCIGHIGFFVAIALLTDGVGDALTGGASATDAAVAGADAATASVEGAGATAPGASVVNKVAGTQNCVSCVIAGDSTLEGSPASAIKLDPDVPIPDGMKEIAEYASARYAGAKWNWVRGQGPIDRQLLAAGDGARGIVYGVRRNGTAHVWNAAVQRGRVNYIDFQTGGKGSFNGYYAYAFIRTG